MIEKPIGNPWESLQSSFEAKTTGQPGASEKPRESLPSTRRSLKRQKGPKKTISSLGSVGLLAGARAEAENVGGHLLGGHDSQLGTWAPNMRTFGHFTSVGYH